MKEHKKRFRRSRNIIEFKGPLGTDEEYEFREFHKDEDERTVKPGGWELAFLEGNMALYRRKRAKIND